MNSKSANRLGVPPLGGTFGVLPLGGERLNCGDPPNSPMLSPKGGTPNAFTLIEVILALGIFALVLVSISTAFFAALRLRQKTSERIEEGLPLTHALSVLRRDLQNTLPPGGVLAGDFRSGNGGAGGSSSSSTARANRGLSTSQNVGLDFFTSTGRLSDSQPWGDIQEVNYQLQEPADRAHAYGRDLVRTVTRNLLATATQATDVQRLVGNVEDLQFLYFDGTQWRDSWDTSAGDTGLPAAVRVRIQLASSDGPTLRGVQPLEMVVLLESQSVTNLTQ
jgi:type II secretion system protein J